ncbi:hypothetical protein PR001_g29870 [Phytophthora rubi]|uniref:Uncharacterized protein n=2 Tax=Phytophthora TaxID=4783 RepID=A0A6A3GYA2_9STRA|nr:hypothetical protein PR001_g29870 [Phytophthora rubi]KAE8962172.1 hypothetical protein PR002_g29680 [Phytophthora rubi]
MTSVSKAFNYIVSTTQEDQQVGKILAGWNSEAEHCLPTLRVFDPVVANKARQLQDSLFSCAFGFAEPLNLRDDVIEVLMAVAILHYHDILKLSPEGPYIKHIQQKNRQHGISEPELASWSLTMHSDLIKRMKRSRPEKQAVSPSVNDVVEKQTVLIKQQMDMISSLSS